MQKFKENILGLFLIVIVFLVSCSQNKQEAAYTPPTPTNLSGEELAKTYCGSCHLYPEPALLDKKTWQNGVLPKMAYRLGMGNAFDLLFNMSEEEGRILLNANIYPEHPALAVEDWKKIQDFYVQNAPEKPIEQAKKEAVIYENKLFEVRKIALLNDSNPLTTLVKFNSKNQNIYIGNRRGYVEIYDFQGNKKDSITVPSSPSDIYFSEPSPTILTMGVMDPNDLRRGKLVVGNQVVLDSLRRPVEMTYADLNQDAKQDLIICNYGNEMGELAWYEAETMKKHVLKPISGARNVIIHDLNKDNLPDVLVLMAQAREGIYVFYNKGKGEFEEKNLLEFLPVYGSSYFELADFNNDGFQDILYTNGDNADYSIIPKAFHGVRIFLNDKKNNFKEAYFYPMFGASKAKATDFDLDGDLDIAAISFFPENDSETFVMLQNQGNLQFKASSIKETKQGGLLVMDIADMDSDGDKDIILGSFIRNLPENAPKKLYKALVLENKTNH